MGLVAVQPVTPVMADGLEPVLVAVTDVDGANTSPHLPKRLA
jgi:hypothetical protein